MNQPSQEEQLRELCRHLRREGKIFACLRKYGMSPEGLRAELARRLKRNVLLQQSFVDGWADLIVEVPFKKRERKAVQHGS